jgi:CRISPR-associated protein Cmr4
MNARLYFVHALSPLHAGTGQGVGVIDLPIAREKATGLPYLPGSSLKGVLRDGCTDGRKNDVFGPETENAEKHAGSAQFTDARLLLLPIRSLAGTFAWVTSPYVLRRFLRDAGDAQTAGAPATIPAPVKVEECRVAQAGCQIQIADGKPRVYLEDLDLTPAADTEVDAWAAWLGQRIFPNDPQWQETLKGRLCVVHDDVLTFLLETATEITARIKLMDDKKTVQKGGLWYEEALPTETVLSGLIVATPIKATEKDVFAVLQQMAGKTMQVGGKATVGRGLCRLQIGQEGNNGNP